MSATKKIDTQSGSACSSSLNFFSLPPTEVSINRTQLKEVLPLNNPNEDPIEFRHHSDNQFIDLSKTYLYMKLSIEKMHEGEWVTIEAADRVAPVNSIGTSIIKQMRVSISSNDVFDSSSLFPYLAYIKNLINYSRDYKQTVLSSIGYYEDGLDHDAENNPSHVKRMQIAAEGRAFECFCPLNFDLASQPLFLLNHLDVLFTFYRSDDRFLIKTYDDNDQNTYRIRMHSMKMFVRTVDVQPAVNMSIMRTLENTPAKYATKKLQIRSTFISQGRTQLTQNLFSNIIPKRLIAALVSNRAFNGSLSHSPYNFKPYGIREIFANAGGTNIPLIPYNASFNNERDPTVMRLFMQMHETCALGPQQTNGITYDQFCRGSCLFVLPLNTSLNECEGFSLVKEGTTSIHLEFSEPVAEALTLICIGEFDGVLMLTKDRVVLTDSTI